MLDKHNVENGNYIAALRVWRNQDHEDNLIMSRNEVIELLREIDTRKGKSDFERAYEALRKANVPPPYKAIIAPV